MSRDDRRYRSYLVRLWDEGPPGTPHWRASLEDPDTGERLGFADLARLFAFLEAQTGTAAPGDHEATPPNDAP